MNLGGQLISMFQLLHFSKPLTFAVFLKAAALAVENISSLFLFKGLYFFCPYFEEREGGTSQVNMIYGLKTKVKQKRGKYIFLNSLMICEADSVLTNT